LQVADMNHVVFGDVPDSPGELSYIS